jgi:hypothetical protein
MANSGKIAEVLFENALETYEDQTSLVDKAMVFTPDGGTMQNAGNVVWRPVDQHAPILSGWDLTGQEQAIIEQTYPAYLGTPTNDFVQQRADDMRDMTFWERRGKASGRQQVTNLNSGLANLIKNTGSLFYRSNAATGIGFIGQAQKIMNERQGAMTERCFYLNDAETLTYATELGSKQTMQGRPEADAWSKGQIGNNVAEFDIYTSSFNPVLIGGASPATTTTAATSFKPTGGTVDPATYEVTNTDYRVATIPVAASGSYNVGDKVTFAGVNSIGLASKTDTGSLMTFTIVAKPNATSVQIYPKPIALSDGTLTVTEAAYANVTNVIGSGVVMARLNIDASAKSNLFFDKDSIEVVGGTIPAQLLSQYDGLKVVNQTMSNGLNMYMVYDANMVNMQLRYRLFVWYGLTNKDPSRNGVAVKF